MTRFRLLLLFCLSVFSLWTASGQDQVQTNITLTANPAQVFVGTPSTLTATLTVASGSVTATNGLQVQFASPGFSTYVTLENGLASFTFDPGCSDLHGCDTQIFVSFAGNAAFGPSSAGTNVFAELPGGQLRGAYAFRFSGNSKSGRAFLDLAAVGSMTADGRGNLKGVEDVNTRAGVFAALPFTGTYTFDLYGVGTMTLTSSQGVQTYAIYLPTTTPNTYITSPPTGSAVFIETDGEIAGSGVLASQTLGPDVGSSLFAQNPGSYSVEGAGLTVCASSLCTSAADVNPVPVFLGAQLSLAVAGTVDLEEGVTRTQGASIYGNASAPDSSGRSLFYVYGNFGAADTPSNYVVYFIDASHFYYMSTDSHVLALLLSGTASERP